MLSVNGNAVTGEALRRQAHRERNGWGKRPLVLRDDQLVRNEIGMRRLCAWLKIPTDGGAWDVARRYLRWCKRNPQPRADKR